MNDTENGGCPETAVLQGLLEQTLDESTLQSTVDHVEACAGCQTRLEELMTPAPSGLFTPEEVDQADMLSTLPTSSNDHTSPGFTPPAKCIAGIELLHCIAQGGMGAVYAAQQHDPVARKVAVKFVRPDRLDDELLKRFQRERSLLASIDHPNVAHLFEAGQLDTGEPYFVMEFVDGESIVEHCCTHRLALRQRLALFLQVADAVQYLHTKQMIHRDIKPSNILVWRAGESSQVKIIDFGLAKEVTIQPGDVERTLDGQPIGTLRYMSPEQTGRRGAEQGGDLVDARTDVYSLGVLLYELITGDTPLSQTDANQSTLAELLERISQREAEYPSKRLGSLTTAEHLESLRASREQLRKETLRDLDWIVGKALRIEPRERYATVEALARDIRNYLDDQPVAARPPSLAYATRKFYRRNPVVVWSAGLLLLALIAGISGTTYGLVEARKATKVAEKRAAEEKAAKVEANRLRGEERKARLQSEERRAKIRRAAAVLQGVFEEINPEIAAAGNSGQLRAELIQRLQEASTRLLDEELAEDSDVLVLKFSLAKTLIALGESKSSIPLIENVIEDSFNDESVQWSDRVALLMTLWQAHREEGNHDEASQLLQRAARVADQQLSPDDPTRLAMMHYLSVSQTDQGETAAALKTVENVLEQIESSDASGDLTNLYFLALNQFAVLKRKTGDHAAAVDALRKVVDHWSSLLPKQHPLVLQSKANLALALDDQGETAAAIESLREVLETTTQQYPVASNEVCTAKINLAAVLARSDEFDEAERLLTEVGSSDNPALASRARIERILLRNRRGDDREQLNKEAEMLINELRETHGEDAGIVGEARQALAALL